MLVGHGKFFDNIDSAILWSEMTQLPLPMHVCLLVVRQHMAPRRLQYAGYLSDHICPTGTILPGCLFAIPFVRVYFRTKNVPPYCILPCYRLLCLC